MKEVNVSLHNHIVNPRNQIWAGYQKRQLRSAIENAFANGIDVLAITEMANERDCYAPFRYIEEGVLGDDYTIDSSYSGFHVIEKKTGEQRGQKLYFCSGVEADVIVPRRITGKGEVSGQIVLIGVDPEELKFRESKGKVYTDDERRANWDIFEEHKQSGDDLLRFAPHPYDPKHGCRDSTIELVNQGYIHTYEAYNGAFGRVRPQYNAATSDLEDKLEKKGISNPDSIVAGDVATSYIRIKVDTKDVGPEEFMHKVMGIIKDGKAEEIQTVEEPLSRKSILLKGLYSRDRVTRGIYAIGRILAKGLKLIK